MLLRAARMYFREARRAWSAGNIQGSGERLPDIISQKRNSPSMLGSGGSSFGRVGSAVWARI